MNHDLFYQYNPWWEIKDFSLEVIPRPYLQALLENHLDERSVVFLTGLRRVGKTTLLKMLIQSLLHKGILPQHIFYISLDDFLLNNSTILDIVAEYRKLHRLTFDTKVFLFFDEITYKKDFRLQLKNIYDHQNAKVFVSSSSSSAARDKKGFLTGRERVIEITPLNFDEFLNFRGITIKERDAALKESYFEEYMQMGGMPEYVLKQNRDYLTALVEDILYKDIVAFHGLKRPQLIKDYFSLLMERAGKQISLNKIAKILGISTDTAKRYMQMFEDTFLVYLVSRYGKTNETILSPKKIYAADLGIRNLFTGFRDKGALFENIVFLTIKSQNPRYIYKNGTEIDFITENKTLIEVKYGNELNTNQMELFNEFKANKKLIIRNFHDLSLLESNS